ncbi:MAG: DNA-directed RNA polymerase subunit delta [Syntrophomonadaceae bacterium]
MKGKKSEVDLAVEVLMARQQPVYFLDLIKQVAQMMGKDDSPSTIASILTRINLDNRLVYQKDGYWYYDSNKIQQGGEH